MAINKETNGTYTVQAWYRTWTGERRKKTKRGFRTKADARKWEQEFQLTQAGSPDMTFDALFGLYRADVKPRLKLNTWLTKENIARKHLLPYFGDKKVCDITPADVLAWQTALLAAEPSPGKKKYSRTYIRTIENQLSAIFNHAVRYYGLRSNPMLRTGKVGKKETEREMLFWTKQEYLAFSKEIMDKPTSFAVFEVLYWCGLREGEALALTPADFDFEKLLLSVTKSYQRINGEDIITSPKTPKSVRKVAMPQFVADELSEYVAYMGFKPDQRIFQVTKHFLAHEIERGSKLAGVKRIRVHDLRHSHVSLLISLGFNVLAIADRVGHESTDITFRYAHLMPTTQGHITQALENVAGGERR